jgi:predicted dehydrogenase
MKILIAGYGSIGRRHFRNLRNLGVDDILFFRTNKSTIEKDEISNYVVESDLNKALAHKPDAVIVSNPTSLHLDVAIPAAKAGCHLMIEKPVSHNMDRLVELRRTIEQNNNRVLIGFQFRYHPGLKQIKSLIEAGRIGNLLSVRSHWGEYLPDWHPWENYQEGYSARADLGGGVVLTLCHPFDYLRWMVGDVSATQAVLGFNSDLGLNDVEDTAEINLRFTNNVIGSVHLNYNQRPPIHEMQLVGSDGTINWNGLDGSYTIYTAETGEWEGYSLGDDFSRNDLFLSEMRHFLDVIKTGKQPLCSLDDGIAVQKLIQDIKLTGIKAWDIKDQKK